MKKIFSVVSLGLFLVFALFIGSPVVSAEEAGEEVRWQIELKDLDGEYYSLLDEEGWSSEVRGAGHGINGTISGNDGSFGQKVDLTAEGSRFQRKESGSIDDMNFTFEVIVEGEDGIVAQEESEYLGDGFIWGAPSGDDLLLQARGKGFIYWQMKAEKPDEVFELIKVAEVGNELIIAEGSGFLYAPNSTDSISPVAVFDGDGIYSPGDTDIIGVYAEEESYGNFTLYVSGDEHIKAMILGAGIDQDIGEIPDAYYVHGDFMRKLWFDGEFNGDPSALLGPDGEPLVSFSFEGS